MSFAIFTDTSANLPTPKTKELDITVVPLSYTVDGEEHVCLDTEAFPAAEYYESMKGSTVIKTSQVNPQKYLDYMEPALKEGKDILFVGMSSGISGSFASAKIAREQLLEEYPDRSIRLVDSLGASLGEGLLALKGNDCREKGMSLDETADYLEQAKGNLYQLFTVDNLMHLRKGGRLSNAAAIVGSLLNIKPLLKGNENGQIVSFEKVRGRKAVINEIAKRYDQLVLEPQDQIVGISHCHCPEDAAKLADLIRQNRAPKDIIIVEHEPVTGSYLGPGALALYFGGDKDVRLH